MLDYVQQLLRRHRKTKKRVQLQIIYLKLIQSLKSYHPIMCRSTITYSQNLLYLCKLTRSKLQLAVVFLSTRYRHRRLEEVGKIHQTFIRNMGTDSHYVEDNLVNQCIVCSSSRLAMSGSVKTVFSAVRQRDKQNKGK